MLGNSASCGHDSDHDFIVRNASKRFLNRQSDNLGKASLHPENRKSKFLRKNIVFMTFSLLKFTPFYFFDYKILAWKEYIEIGFGHFY